MKIQYQNREVEVDEVEVVSTNEPWCEYQLADGTLLRHKTVLLNVAKARHEKNPDGSTLYVVKTHNVVNIRETQ